MTDDEAFLAAADDMGSRLCAEAIRHDDRCVWLGDRQNGGSGTRRRFDTVSLDAGFYSGNAGVGWFLAELAKVSGEAIHRKTAAAALWQSLFQTEERTQLTAGFYSGEIGVAWALARAGDVLEAEEFVEGAGRVLSEARDKNEPRGNTDVIAGSAGAIPALLTMGARTNDDSLTEWAVELGDEMLGRAERSEHGWSWRTVSDVGPRLTGLAHGAAGFALAFARLFAATGESRFCQAAKEAMRYERHWYRDDVKNWPDLRGAVTDATPATTGLKFMRAWCHGAPGIALSRMVAAGALPDEEAGREADVALATTASSVSDFNRRGVGNFSLCHGAGGNADILLSAGRQLGRSELVELARETGAAGWERFGENRPAWPCGFAGEAHTPNLMIGLAGMGLFFLRLRAGAAIPSALLPGGE